MREAKLPTMASPEEALGADLFDHLPEGQEGLRWRALLSEAQVALHQHPLNAQRQAAGKPPVSVTHHAGTLDEALKGAIRRLRGALDTKVGQLNDHKGAPSIRDVEV